MRITRRLVALALILMPAVATAHHGGYGITYDQDNLWSTWGTVTSFNFINPHPMMTFDRTAKDGTVEKWTAELLTAPAPLARAGWTKARSVEALKPGTRVKLYLATARKNKTSALVMHLENDKGEGIVYQLQAGRTPTAPKAVDLDGVPLGHQPAQ